MKLIFSDKTRFSLRTYLWLFFFVSAAGCLWESFLYLLFYHSVVKRGFFHGPWLPVYGTGAVILEWLLQAQPTRLSHRIYRSRFSHAVFIFFLSAIVCSLFEYAIGTYLEWRYQIRYWDYRGFPLQLNGRVCLFSFLLFGIGGLLLHDLIFPAIRRFSGRLSSQRGRFALRFLLLLFLCDLVYSCYFPNTGRNITFPVFFRF